MTTTSTSPSPVSLSYMASLRGYVPRTPGKNFTYALANCSSAELLIGLAASNPEGRFYGLISDASAYVKALKQLEERQVNNASFLPVNFENAEDLADLPMLDYLVCDETVKPLSPAARAGLFDVAAARLKPNGLFNCSYKAYDKPESALQFIVHEFAPEMNADQAFTFLKEIKMLGEKFFATHPDLAAKLDAAIAKRMPDEFFDFIDVGACTSPTFDTIVALRSRGLVFGAAAQVEGNYVELSIPYDAQSIVISCSDNPLCEPIKDLAALRQMRSDIWCKSEAAMSKQLPELFGSFAYGITLPLEKVPQQVDVFGKKVDVSGPLYRSLIELMTMQPMGIGDFLAHTTGKGFNDTDVVGAVQVLVALGIARPMRGAREESHVHSMAQPRFRGNFNRYMDQVPVAGDTIMASAVMGDVMNVSSRDVLVMQALNRAGLANSVSALLPELQRLAKNPASAAAIMDVAEPTAEVAHRMIDDVVTESFVQWYAYGLLEAA
jgi:hypothetical protein